MTSGVHKCSVVSNDVKNPLHFEAFWVAFATPPFKLTYFFLPAPPPSSSISLLTPAPHSSTLSPKAQKRTEGKFPRLPQKVYRKVYRKVSGSLPEKPKFAHLPSIWQKTDKKQTHRKFTRKFSISPKITFGALDQSNILGFGGLFRSRPRSVFSC